MWTIEKWSGYERGLVEKERATGEPVSIALKPNSGIPAAWYTL